jgi:branched-chain amino acid transport system permease protein
VTGVLPATRGEVQFLRPAHRRLPSRRIAQRGVSRTFQHVKMIPGMTVLENVALGRTLRGGAACRGDAAPRTVPRSGAAARGGTAAEAHRHGGHMHELAGNLALGRSA